MVYRFQEKYDMENSIEHVHVDALSEGPQTPSKDREPIEIDEDLLIITSTFSEQVETDDDDLITDGERENKGATRRGYSSCEDCDIPFITKKQLKVNCIALFEFPLKKITICDHLNETATSAALSHSKEVRCVSTAIRQSNGIESTHPSKS